MSSYVAASWRCLRANDNRGPTIVALRLCNQGVVKTRELPDTCKNTWPGYFTIPWPDYNWKAKAGRGAGGWVGVVCCSSCMH